jgi:hypothetical protein
MFLCWMCPYTKKRKGFDKFLLNIAKLCLIENQIRIRADPHSTGPLDTDLHKDFGLDPDLYETNAVPKHWF